MAKLNFR